MRDFIVSFNGFVIFYFIIVNAVYILLFALSLRHVIDFVRRTFFSDYRRMMRSSITWPVSVLVPARNEESTIVETLKSTLIINYPEYEVLVVNDGSTDQTMSVLAAAFQLEPVDRPIRAVLPTAHVRCIYRSREHPNLYVIDKDPRGKSDALNAGINLSRYPLFCSIDADSVIEPDALLRVVRPFMERPSEVVAAGGVVRIANGCEIRDGRVVGIGLPKRPLARFQVVEYLRSFLTGRVGFSAIHSLLIIAGAFGVYRRDRVIEIGGYSDITETEDLELIVRLHRDSRRRRHRYRIVFVPDPVCWTKAPEDFDDFAAQRNRWHRGLVRTVWKNRGMMLNPRYGAIGMFAFPYFALFEMAGPFVELAGYFTVAMAIIFDVVSVEFLILFAVVAFLIGVFLSVSAVLLEEIALRRYPNWRQLAVLVGYGILDNIGYRQMLAMLKIKAQIDVFRGRRAWGRARRPTEHQEIAA